MGSSILCFSFNSFVCNLIIYLFFLLTLSRFSFSQPFCHDEESASLLEFKESFIINMSVSSDSLAYSKISFWTNKSETRNCCVWHGVECDEITGRVISLDLSSSYLYGSLDSNSSLFKLVHLRRLNLADNHFNYSRIPTAIKWLSMLTHLNLSRSVFSDQIPSEVSELSKLVSLDLSFNADPVSGEHLLELKKPMLEKLFSNLTSLEKLRLSYVKISTAMPKLLGNLSSLTSLLLEDCDLIGEFPVDIFQLPNLQFLSVCFNKDLSGRLPRALNHKSSLKVLLLRETGFSGELPSSMEKLASLTEFDASGCNFSGVIPASIGMLNQLTFLDLSENNFVGEIPFSLGNLTQLVELYLSSNQFRGPIPSSFSKLVNLKNLSVGDNNFSGLVDFNIFVGMKNLSFLNLSRNNLSLLTSPGTNETFPQFISLQLSNCNLRNIPDFLRHQKRVEILKLNRNQIGGEIPDWMLNMSISRTLHTISLYKNSLVGKISPKICNLRCLKVLDLSHNKLDGKLPHCFGEFSKSVWVIRLRNNSFSGHIPEFTEGNQLNIIDLGYNLFEGKLPKSLTNCMMLGYLNVEKNRLNDVFPHWLGVLPELEVLVFHANGFHGAIGEPQTNLHFPKLHIIDLSYNNFFGKLPLKYIQSWKAMNHSIEDFDYMKSMPFKDKSKASLTLDIMDYYFHTTIAIKGMYRYYEKIQNILAVINLSNNKFDGEIPQVIGNLKGLHSLDLSNNLLEGAIPSSLSNLAKLESLDLSQNSLSGEIPYELDQLSFLQYFNVSHNHLSGSIPQVHLSRFESSSYEGNLGLCGIPLSNQCEHSKPLLEPPLPSSEEESSSPFQFDWKVVAIGYGCGILIGPFVEKIIIARRPMNRLVMIFRIRS
ncbi:receptor-like protein 6 [Humulus lupulus]|uniref:receptor-like protein 6 n=1 Tax=Humulus lupulus TaxID=3486 RepID=UPI002B4107BB|nr:receptor-like protein 6 [Humulus lupulus]